MFKVGDVVLFPRTPLSTGVTEESIGVVIRTNGHPSQPIEIERYVERRGREKLRVVHYRTEQECTLVEPENADET